MEQHSQGNGRRGGDRERKRGFQTPLRKNRPHQEYRQEDDFNWNKVLKVVLSWSAIILLVFLVMTGTSSSSDNAR